MWWKKLKEESQDKKGNSSREWFNNGGKGAKENDDVNETLQIKKEGNAQETSGRGMKGMDRSAQWALQSKWRSERGLRRGDLASKATSREQRETQTKLHAALTKQNKEKRCIMGVWALCHHWRHAGEHTMGHMRKSKCKHTRLHVIIKDMIAIWTCSCPLWFTSKYLKITQHQGLFSSFKNYLFSLTRAMLDA